MSDSSLLQDLVLALCQPSLQFHYFRRGFEFESRSYSDGLFLFVGLIDELVKTSSVNFLVRDSGYPELVRRVRVNSEKRLLASSRLSVCLPVCVGVSPTGRILVKFNIGDLYENMSRNSDFGET